LHLSGKGMKIIGSKKEIQPYLEKAIGADGQNAFIAVLHSSILKKKVRFPVLEYAAAWLYDTLPVRQHLSITDQITGLKEIGSYILAGIMLQKMLAKQYDKAIAKAVEYIIAGNKWYVCDIIGERVMGYALLTKPEQTLPVLRRLAKHDDKWIVRSVGVAGHYAIKKGLSKEYVQELFELLLSVSNTTDFHTKKGIGWAAKTTAKFHPDIIAKYKNHIDTSAKQWFKTKVKTGLGRSEKYAHRYSS